MKYRAVLNEPPQNNGAVIKGAQIVGNHLPALQAWAREMLRGRTRPASVEIFRQSEVICDVIYPEEHS